MKEVAPRNIPRISVTLHTFHLFSGWLKELADAYHHELTWIMITNGERTHAKARPAVRWEFDVRCNLQR